MADRAYDSGNKLKLQTLSRSRLRHAKNRRSSSENVGHVRSLTLPSPFLFGSAPKTQRENYFARFRADA
jgi:hypothetical protein